MIFMIVVRIDALYYTAVHIPTKKKEAEYTMRHLSEIYDMPDYFHDVIGVVHHLAEVDDVAAFHSGKVVPAVFLAADLERRMPVLPICGMYPCITAC